MAVAPCYVAPLLQTRVFLSSSSLLQMPLGRHAAAQLEQGKEAGSSAGPSRRYRIAYGLCRCCCSRGGERREGLAVEHRCTIHVEAP